MELPNWVISELARPYYLGTPKFTWSKLYLHFNCIALCAYVSLSTPTYRSLYLRDTTYFSIGPT